MCGVIATAPTVVRNSVYPSGGDFATKSAPIAPLAPGLFSMMTWPSDVLELVGDQPADEIGRSAGREGDHHADRPVGEVLRLRGGRGRGKQQDSSGEFGKA